MAHSNGRLGLRWEEGAALGGFLLLFTLGIAFGINWHFRTYFTRNGAGLLLIVASLYLVTAFRDAVSRGQPVRVGWWLRQALGFARDWGPFVALIVLYENLLPLVGRVHPALYDRLAMRLDVAIFGSAPSLWLEPLVTRGRTEWLSFFYLSLFALPIISGGLLYLRGRRADFREFLLAFTLAGLVGYAGYLLVPIIGPRYYFAELYRTSLGGVSRGAQLMSQLPFTAAVDQVSHHDALASGQARNCFPSLHTAWGLIVLVYAFRQMRWLFYIYLFPVAWLVFATIYLRLHYVVDVVAGATLALSLCALVPRWFRRSLAATRALPSLPVIEMPRWASRVAERLAQRVQHSWPSCALVLLVAPVYLSSLPSGLTDRNRGADGGELVAAALSGGTAHPPGYPLYCLLLRGASALVPAADPIDVAHHASAVLGLLAGLLIAATTRRCLEAALERSWATDLAALLAGAVYCFGRAAFSQALIAEVYALHGVFVALLIWLTVHAILDPSRVRPRYAAVFGLTCGLAITHHLTAAAVAAVCGLALLLWSGGRLRSPKTLAALLAGGVLGLVPWIYLPLTAAAEPRLSWGTPSSWQQFQWLVTAAQYRYRFGGSLADAFARLASQYSLRQATALVLGLATVAALVVSFSGLSDRENARSAQRRIVWFLLALLAVNTVSSMPYAIADLQSYFLPAEACVAVLAGIGCYCVIRALADVLKRPWLIRAAAWSLATLCVTWSLATSLPAVDAHGRSRLDRQVRDILRHSPPGALVAARGDAMVFGLWYEQHVRSHRADLDVVSRELLLQKWYSTASLHTPQLRWPKKLQGPPTERLEQVIAANYGRRPIVVVHPADVPLGCSRNAHGLLTFCEPSLKLALTLPKVDH